ncbi:hypothetical protein LTR39_002163 [Cryomyces antarcticus]|nr:hypothetical protein LTR39_002163 [Cryomyces antarcticus]
MKREPDTTAAAFVLEDEITSAVRGRGRPPKAREGDDFEYVSASTGSLTTRTPQTSSHAMRHVTLPTPPAVAFALPVSSSATATRSAHRATLPASPAVVTDVIDHQAHVLQTEIKTAWYQTGIPENISYLREVLSSVVAVEAAVLLFEAYCLQQETLPFRYAFDIPPSKVLGTVSHPVFLPDFFRLVTASFWTASTLWVCTSLLIPLLFAYFFNFTTSAKPESKSIYRADPLTFNIIKAVTAWLVYSQGVRFWGLVGDHTVVRVDEALLGGYKGVMIGAGIGVLTSLYETVLKK